MNRDPQTTFTRIGDVLARHAIPELRRAARLPLRVACIGVASYDGGGEIDGFDRSVVVGHGASPEEAMRLASERVSCGDIRVEAENTLRFRPRLAVIHDRDRGLVLAGAIRAGIVLWQQPVSSEAEARNIVSDASRLRGFAFTASGRGEHASAREFRFSAATLEARLVDPVWREIASGLLRLPQAA